MGIHLTLEQRRQLRQLRRDGMTTAEVGREIFFDADAIRELHRRDADDGD